MVEPEDKDDNLAYADHCGFAMPQPFARTSRCRAKEHQKENGPGQSHRVDLEGADAWPSFGSGFWFQFLDGYF